jgi:hypothetical protein
MDRCLMCERRAPFGRRSSEDHSLGIGEEPDALQSIGADFQQTSNLVVLFSAARLSLGWTAADGPSPNAWHTTATVLLEKLLLEFQVNAKPS